MEKVIGYVTNPNPTPTLTPNPNRNSNSNPINKKTPKKNQMTQRQFGRWKQVKTLET
jgi:hypothetical protein